MAEGRRITLQVCSVFTDCANDLNSFYAHFDSHDFGDDRDRLKKTLTEAAKSMAGEGIVVDGDDVLSGLKKTKPYVQSGWTRWCCDESLE